MLLARRDQLSRTVWWQLCLRLWYPGCFAGSRTSYTFVIYLHSVRALSPEQNSAFSINPPPELLGFNGTFFQGVCWQSQPNRPICDPVIECKCQEDTHRTCIKSKCFLLLASFHSAELLVCSMQKEKQLLCFHFLLTFLFGGSEGGGGGGGGVHSTHTVTHGTALWHFHKIPTTRILIITKTCAFSSDP